MGANGDAGRLIAAEVSIAPPTKTQTMVNVPFGSSPQVAMFRAPVELPRTGADMPAASFKSR